ncbi:Crp/Fnr family transcriptional regulator [Terriglobus aquaticus]|uniref:Crp/Fnr family transcriptional regulator n=1 Tax=Terriglobus aquaticus TaxID=940139 RepID=A0ABW9KJB3_9BACT|nr:Crp/Fnr family transcriptional regulator [Terriglobus aquaticus]
MTNNCLLDGLPEPVRANLLSQMETIPLPVPSSIFVPDQEPRFVHFLTSGLASVVTTMEGGESVEVGLTGREGFPERVHLLGPQRGNTRCFVQMAGEALRMQFRAFQEYFLTCPPLMHSVHQFVQHDSLVLAQLSACNRLHEVEARLARWLLMAQDRVASRDLPLTQEFLGQMLGTRRSTVNLAAGSLQRAGVITFTRGRVRIEDREALEGMACECYPIVAELFRSLYR